MTAPLWNTIPASWQDCLESCRSEIAQLDQALSECEDSGTQFVPTRSKIFAALEIPPSDVSVVMIGQDPYPSANHAIGLAFAVPSSTTPLPGSLRNLFKEIQSDTGKPSTSDASLSSWVSQGVLLLNTSLTTEIGERGAHASWPWEKVVRTVIAQVRNVNPKVVGLFLGNHARSFTDAFSPDSIVEASHPSPLSANRGFFGSKPFTRVNEILVTNNRSVISW